MSNSWNMKTPKSQYQEEKKEFVVKFTHDANGSLWFHTSNGNEVLKFIDSFLQKQKEDIVDMLWSMHVDEKDKESEIYNRALDLAIFRIKNPTNKILERIKHGK